MEGLGLPRRRDGRSEFMPSFFVLRGRIAKRAVPSIPSIPSIPGILVDELFLWRGHDNDQAQNAIKADIKT
jgi:hypothetical protein